MPNRYVFRRGAQMPSVESARPSFLPPPRRNLLLILRLIILGFPEWITKLVAPTNGDMSNASFLSRIERNKWIRVTQVNAIILLSSIAQVFAAELGTLEVVFQLILLASSALMINHGRRVCAQFGNARRSSVQANLQEYWHRTVYLCALQTAYLGTTLLGRLFSSVKS